MQPRPEALGADRRDRDPSEEIGWVSPRFLSELFRTLARQGLAPGRLIGDLPILLDESGRVMRPVQWDHFGDFLRRLEHHAGGSEALEACGEGLCGARGARPFRGLVALTTSPTALYRATVLGGLRRAIPGLEVGCAIVGPARLSLEVRMPEPLRACPQLLHVVTGAVRTLPRLLDMPDAVVAAKIDERHAHYDVRIPASRTALARLRRFVRAVLSPGSVLRYLEDKQLELHARFASLSRAHASLLASERRLRALSDAAVDMLCEIDASGRIVFVSASVRELMGYSREQVTGSHYRLWVPTRFQALARSRFETLRDAPIGTAFVKQTLELHAAHGLRVLAEVSVRSHRTAEGEWRAVAVLRDVSREDALLHRLRAGATALAGRRPSHPLERSLPELVALLESLESGGRAGSPDRALAVARRMTRIVEHTLLSEQAHEHDPETDRAGGGPCDAGAHWIEARKLFDRVRDAHLRRPDAGRLALELEHARGPAELFGHEALLEACVEGLVEWAGERALAAGRVAGGATLRLSLEPVERLEPDEADESEATDADRAGAPHAIELRIVIELGRDGTAGPLSRAASPAMPPAMPPDAALALAVADDAARSLGGRLLPAAEGGLRSAIRLPQPSR